jgi:hypothetical protein
MPTDVGAGPWPAGVDERQQRVTDAARRGAKKAIVAVAHSLLRIIYHLLAHDCPYQELGAHYLDQRDREQIERRLVRRLEASAAPLPSSRLPGHPHFSQQMSAPTSIASLCPLERPALSVLTSR